MLRLLVMRHGKSDWDAGAAGDIDRPLASRGIRAARLMGRILSDGRVIPDRVLTSPAVRARRTAELAVETGGWPVAPVLEERLYTAGVDGVLAVLHETPEPPPTTQLVVGHQPWCAELVALLVGGAAVRFPTAAVALVELDADGWDRVRPGRGELRWLLPPKLVARLV